MWHKNIHTQKAPALIYWCRQSIPIEINILLAIDTEQQQKIVEKLTLKEKTMLNEIQKKIQSNIDQTIWYHENKHKFQREN